jgi:hypothetical protein
VVDIIELKEETVTELSEGGGREWDLMGGEGLVDVEDCFEVVLVDMGLEDGLELG